VDVDVALLERELPVLQLALHPLQAGEQRVAVASAMIPSPPASSACARDCSTS
jgi:hypothetical protein